MSKGKVLVMGGGPCGLAAGLELGNNGYEVTVVDAHDKVGGLGSHKTINGNNYEYGTHVFHTDNPKLLSMIRGLMGTDLIELERGSNIQIKYRGRYFHYPLKGINLVTNLPPHVAAMSAVSLARSMVWYDGILRRKPKNTEEYLIQKFGKVLYESFFRDYSRKVWGIPCAELDAEFGAQRIPRSDIFSVVKQVLDKVGLNKLLDPHPLSEKVIGNIFYCAQGVGQIYQRMADQIRANGNQVLVGSRLKRLIVENGKVKAAVIEQNGTDQQIAADFFISTIPLSELASSLKQSAPSEVCDAAEKLYYRSIALVGLLVDKPQVRPAYFTYYQDYTFNRLSEPTNHGLAVNKRDHSLLLAETVCEYGDDAYKGEPAYVKQVVDDILTEGLVTKKEIVEVHPYSWRHAYPIYSVGFRDRLNKIGAYVNSVPNLYSTGRQGRFTYVNMHIAVQMGLDSLPKVDSYFDKYA